MWHSFNFFLCVFWYQLWYQLGLTSRGVVMKDFDLTHPTIWSCIFVVTVHLSKHGVSVMPGIDDSVLSDTVFVEQFPLY